MQLKHSCKFGRGYFEKHFCEIILNLDKCMVQEKTLFKKIFTYMQLWRPFSSMEWEHLCNFIEGIMGNNHVKLF